MPKICYWNPAKISYFFPCIWFDYLSQLGITPSLDTLPNSCWTILHKVWFCCLQFFVNKLIPEVCKKMKRQGEDMLVVHLSQRKPKRWDMNNDNQVWSQLVWLVNWEACRYNVAVKCATITPGWSIIPYMFHAVMSSLYWPDRRLYWKYLRQTSWRTHPKF